MVVSVMESEDGELSLFIVTENHDYWPEMLIRTCKQFNGWQEGISEKP